MRFERQFTREGANPFESVQYSWRKSQVRSLDASSSSVMDVEVPEFWSQTATDILAQKYLRRRDVPVVGKTDGKTTTGAENSARQVVDRLAGCWRHWGETLGYFDKPADAQAFYDEVVFMLLRQMAAPNSPQWFNTGLNWKYGITGSAQGHYYVDPADDQVKASGDAYTRPQPHACFIQSVDDDLLGENGVYSLLQREGRIFKYGSGTGTNFSAIRASGEALGGGGVSSGLMSFLKVFDRAAGAIKSGGTTRRAAKMVCLDLDHPEIEEFITWKSREEGKVAALMAGSALLRAGEQTLARQGKDALVNTGAPQVPGVDFATEALWNRGRALMAQGQVLGEREVYDAHFEGEAYVTVSGQNSNNSVRVPNGFLDAVDADADWQLLGRLDKAVLKTVKARKLWESVGRAAWDCADPGVQYDDLINEWHTCPADGRIRASNPCVTGDTLVSTAEGYRRIVDLVGREVEIVGGDGAFRWISQVFKTGHKPVYELKTSAGYKLKLTADHRVLTANRGDVPACELTRDDQVILGHVGFGAEEIQESLGEVIGLAVGDGCVNADGYLMINMDPVEELIVLEEAQRVINSLKPNRFGSVHSGGTTARVATCSPEILEVAGLYAVLDKESAQKKFTDEAFALNKSGQAALLRGLFTADGTVANYGEKGQYVSLDSTSAELLEQVQLMLLGFGIKAKIYSNRRAGPLTSMLPDGKGGYREYPVQQMHSLRVSRSSRVAFERDIGFMLSSPKAGKLAELNRTVGTYNEVMTDTVESLEPLGTADVYDLTEPHTHHFVANGLVVHNCSEYMFLDDTACNLASLNLVTFQNEDGTLDVERYSHAARLWTVVLDISVGMAQFPSPQIARKSYDYRTLGLGYANLGAFLMRAGIPYDSPAAADVTAAITALLGGASYAASAEMAGAPTLGAFPRFAPNRDSMLRVIRNHERAARNAPASEYEGLSVIPRGLTGEFCPEPMVKAARAAWEKALILGAKHGFRNAQVSVLAPTGTIGLLMDCDTTGIEPDFAMVKFKKLAGGGYFKITNQSLPVALRHLGYSPADCEAIERYVIGSGSLEGAPHVNKVTLSERGFTNEMLHKLEKALPLSLSLEDAFHPRLLGRDFLAGLGVSPSALDGDGFEVLESLGFTFEQIEAADLHICGAQTVEGAPSLKPEHYPVFDCASPCGKGTRMISPMGHVRIMSTAQPYISGAISKTVNLPNEATIADILGVYREGHRGLLKAISIYRDGCKLSQPLNAKKDRKKAAPASTSAAASSYSVSTATRGAGTPGRPLRRRLPARRGGFVQEVTVGGHKLFLRTGEYPDGALGEIFIDMYKEGASYRALLNCFAVLTSKALQYGVPLEELVDTFTFTRFEPAGPVEGHENIKNCTSLLDLVFRTLGISYLGQTDLAHVKPPEALTARLPSRAAAPVTADEPAVTSVTPVTTAKPQGTMSRAEAADMSRRAGYTGDGCGSCGSMRVRRNGTCVVCEDCGTTSGCS